jgi:hypothetical protein
MPRARWDSHQVTAVFLEDGLDGRQEVEGGELAVGAVVCELRFPMWAPGGAAGPAVALGGPGEVDPVILESGKGFDGIVEVDVFDKEGAGAQLIGLVDVAEQGGGG